MTSTVQPVPVGEKATKAGPNKVLIVILGIVGAAALFMFVVKPLLLDSKAPPPAPAPATTKAPATGSDPAAKSGTMKTPPGAVTAPATPTAPGGAADAPAPVSASPTADALPQIPQQYAGQQARDPFAPLVQTQDTSGTSSTK